MLIVVKSVFKEEDKYIHKFSYMDDYINYKCYKMIGLMYLVIDVNETSVAKEWDIFHYWYFLNKGLSLNRVFATVVII